MNVALYARVSTDKCEICGRSSTSHNAASAHEFRGQDPEVQLRELRDWVHREEHTLVIEYVDRGVSGTKASRPQLDQLMRDAKKGLRNFEALAVLRLDRFGRSVQHLHNAITELKNANVNFISIKEGFDLATPIGKLFFTILAAVAEFERNLIAERTKEGLKNARAKGHIPGRKVDPAKGPSRTTAWRRAKASQVA